MVDVGPSSMQNVDLPSDIKCPLCDLVYKDAVMIPCCQHSFCEKCKFLMMCIFLFFLPLSQVK